MIKLLRYAGSKDTFVDIINPEINKTNKTIYVEPFLGSGGIFINLEKEFDEYIINDIEPAIVRIFNTVKSTTYDEFITFYNKVITKYGNFKSTNPDLKDEYKQNYYNFRNDFNKKLWQTDSNEEGFALILIYNSCLNSLGRWGPNGFNQSWGNRLYIPDENSWNVIKNKLQRTRIYNKDFFEVLNYIDVDKCIMFLDPPYIKSPSFSYKGIKEDYYRNFINFCNTTKAHILYTDTDHDDLSFKKITLRDNMRNVSPNRTSELKEKEIMFINYDLEKI